MKDAIISLLTFVILVSCERETRSLIETEPEIAPETEMDYKLSEIDYLTDEELLNHSHCFWIINIHSNAGFVIRDSNTYLKYTDSLRIDPLTANCDTATLMNIDFNKYTVIGIMTDYGACDSISKHIELDSVNEKITYIIDIVRENVEACPSVLFLSLSPALVTKLPDQYEVHFKVNRY